MVHCAVALGLTEGVLVETGTVTLGYHEGKVVAEMWVVDVLTTRHCDVVTATMGDALGTFVTEVL